MFMYGENPYGKLKLTSSYWFIYLLFSILVIIVAFNLLIAILSNTFDKVTSTLESQHCRTKVETLFEI